MFPCTLLDLKLGPSLHTTDGKDTHRVFRKILVSILVLLPKESSSYLVFKI